MKPIPREIKDAYPITGTGIRQGERIAHQVRRAFGDPFEASKRCLVQIRVRLAKSESLK